MRLWSLVVVLVLLLSQSRAFAQPGLTPLADPTAPAAAERPEQTVTEHYWAPVLGLDLLALTVAFAGADNESALAGGLLMYAFAAPLFHLGKSNERSAALSVALRVGLPLLAAGAVRTFYKPTTIDCIDDPCYEYVDSEAQLGPMLLAGAGAGVAAMVLDAGLLARRTVKRTLPRVHPIVRSNTGGFSLGLAGSF